MLYKTVRQYTGLKINDRRVSRARLDRFYLKKTWNNRVMNVCITPSDHHMLLLDINLKKTLKANYYWVFKVRLLQECSFCGIFEAFWESWELKKCSFSSLSQCWDVGKVNVKMPCQNYILLINHAEKYSEGSTKGHRTFRKIDRRQ